MRAAQISKYGDVSVIQLKDVEKPAVGEEQVLVEVYASSLNPFDSAVRAGYIEMITPLLPITLGGDIAGIIREIGGNVTDFAVGDKVYGQAHAIVGNSGAFAEFATTKASQVGKMPANIGFDEAASLVLVGVSAVQVVAEHIGLKLGQKLFIHGGAGGIGSIAIQIAKHIGAYVATTATGDGMTFVEQLGADEIIDYKVQDFTHVLKDFDAVFDTVGGDDFNNSFTILKPGGIAVTMIAQSDEAKAKAANVTAIKQATRVSTEWLDQLRQLIETGVVTPQIDKAFPLDQVKDAFLARESAQTKGKVVLEIKKA